VRVLVLFTAVACCACAPKALVRFSGNQALSDVELREVMCTGKPASAARPEEGVPARDQKAIEQLYEERGYIAHVKVPALERGEPIVVEVVEGPQYMFGRMKLVELRPEPVEVDVAEVLGPLPPSVAPGATYSKTAFSAWWTTLLVRRGATTGKVNTQFTADSETRRVDIIVTYTPHSDAPSP
jgi:outer membrane protein assembly factor BamA